MELIDKDALVAEFNRLIAELIEEGGGTMFEQGRISAFEDAKLLLDTIEVKEVGVDLGDPKGDKSAKYIIDTKTLEAKEVGVWKTVDNINPPQADRNKIYCVFTKQHYILATVINHPQDEDLLQWKCTEFPFHRYDMCEGDEYMQIV